ncbi:MAG TPA: NAD(P)H-hydrate epimerase [Candidatus Limnocylindria bacterium]
MTLDGLPVLSRVPTASATQMAAADRIASADLGIPLEVLMENAAHQIAVATRLFAGGVSGMRIAALCGSGNNGGDALAALRHLAGWGADVEALMSAPREKLRPLAALQHDILTKLGVPMRFTTGMKHDELATALAGPAILLDGLLGYGARGAPRGEVARVIETVVSSARIGTVVAVDLPSGIDPDTGESASGTPASVIAASMTVTLALPKTGLPRERARRYVGELVVADIGIPPRAYDGMGIDAHGVFAEGDLVRIIP